MVSCLVAVRKQQQKMAPGRTLICAAMSPAEVTEKLGLHKMKERSWYVHPRYVSLLPL